jgi:hypothetical protein
MPAGGSGSSRRGEANLVCQSDKIAHSVLAADVATSLDVVDQGRDCGRQRETGV